MLARKEPKMDVSVVIPSYNNQATIADVLDALLNQKYNKGQTEIIVIDDHSTDNTKQIIKKYPITKICNGKNLGLAKSLNKGISLAKHQIIVTLHADTIPNNQKWLEQLVAPLTDHNVAAVCSLQIPPNSQRRQLTIWEKMLYTKLGPHNALNDKADAYKRTVLDEIGLFDDKTFRTAGEDEDLALRLRFHEKNIRGSQAQVTHNHYFYTGQHKTSIFRQILKKEYTFGKAGGALRRKYPRYRPGSYIFPISKPFTSDGLFRVVLCIGALIPYVQLAFIPLLIGAASIGITNLATENKKLLILYPFFNILRFATYTIGYIAGIVKGKQT